MKEQPIKVFTVRRYSTSHSEELPLEVIVEASVSLTVNGQVWLEFMCTPVDLEALAVGFLFNEGFLQSENEIESVRLCPKGDNVDIWLSHPAKKPDQWRRTSGCTGGYTAADRPTEDRNTVQSSMIAEVTTTDGDHHYSFNPSEMINLVTVQQIQGMIDQLFSYQNLYRQSGGVHTSLLIEHGEPAIIAEDIGRHNTLDKLAGKRILDHKAFNPCAVLTSGRISSEMLQKASRLNAFLVISRTSPTSLSIEMSKALGITLIGYARQGKFRVYSHPERIADPSLHFIFGH